MTAGGGQHLLVLSKLLPLPADNGGRQRTLATLQLLLAAGHRVTLVGLADADADVAGLEAMGLRVLHAPWPNSWPDRARGLLRRSASISTARFWSSALDAEVRTEVAAHPVDVLLLEYVQLEPYARGLPAARRILMSHNVESDLFASYARSGGGLKAAPRFPLSAARAGAALRSAPRFPLSAARAGAALRSAPAALAARAEAFAVRRVERRVIGQVDLVSVVSERDRERLPARPGVPVVVCPNGWTASPELPAATEPVVAFVASLDWTPNVQAAAWLHGEVWPKLAAEVPGARLLLVGRDPAPAVRAMAGPDVEVTGTVPSVEPHLAASAVAVAPLLTGGGSRLKILEALAAGRPVVATTVGAEGLEDLVGTGVTLADDPGAFAGAVAALLRDPARAAAEGQAGRAAVLERYSWSRTLSPVVSWIDAG